MAAALCLWDAVKINHGAHRDNRTCKKVWLAGVFFNSFYNALVIYGTDEESMPGLGYTDTTCLEHQFIVSFCFFTGFFCQ